MRRSPAITTCSPWASSSASSRRSSPSSHSSATSSRGISQRSVGIGSRSRPSISLSSYADPRGARTYDGEPAELLAARWQVPAVHAFGAVGSTLDAAHALAPAAPSGTVILADEQTAGRGRQGRRWTSGAGAGVWLTLIERPVDARALDVLALRCGLYAAEALDELADAKIQVKWPNDLYVGDRKLAGVLIETRWRGTAPDWVAVGFGLNVIAPDLATATGLVAGTTRLAALDPLLPPPRPAPPPPPHPSQHQV